MTNPKLTLSIELGPKLRMDLYILQTNPKLTSSIELGPRLGMGLYILQQPIYITDFDFLKVKILEMS